MGRGGGDAAEELYFLFWYSRPYGLLRRLLLLRPTPVCLTGLLGAYFNVLFNITVLYLRIFSRKFMKSLKKSMFLGMAMLARVGDVSHCQHPDF